MAKARSRSSLLGTVAACIVIGLVSYFGTALVLGTNILPPGEQGPVEIDAAILAQENPYVADLLAAAQIVHERWSYAEHRKELSGLDLEVLEAEALALLGDHPDAVAFRRAVTYFVAGLQDGHAFVGFAEPRSPGAQRWPFTLIEV